MFKNYNELKKEIFELTKSLNKYKKEEKNNLYEINNELKKLKKNYDIIKKEIKELQESYDKILNDLNIEEKINLKNELNTHISNLQAIASGQFGDNLDDK